ncbi:MAG TPA: hypothetical protein ENN81_02725 [Phycisphaerales bacterium]|nr:hypothetical protein [Phycisphaerales bacterium]
MPADPAVSSEHFTVPDNEIRGFAAWRHESGHPQRPRYHVSFDRLRSVNGRVGQFRTALTKTVCIDNLNLRLFTYATAPNDGDVTPAAHAAAAVAPEHYVLGDAVNSLLDARSNYRLNINFNNTTEVTIRGFGYHLTAEDRPGLAVKCARANIFDWPQITLRGNATITADDGTVFQAANIRWNTKNNTFRADGTCLLTRGGVQTIGRDLCVDARLEVVEAPNRHELSEVGPRPHDRSSPAGGEPLHPQYAISNAPH